MVINVGNYIEGVLILLIIQANLFFHLMKWGV